MEIKLQLYNNFFFFMKDVFVPQHKNTRFMLGRESYNYVKLSVRDESSPKQGLTISFHKYIEKELPAIWTQQFQILSW